MLLFYANVLLLLGLMLSTYTAGVDSLSLVSSSSSPNRRATTAGAQCARREWLAGLLSGSGPAAVALVAAFQPLTTCGAETTPTLDFTVQRETKLPFSQYYVENARRLATNLQWAAFHSNAEVDEKVKQQILAFSSLYRRDNYTQYGPLPGLQSLMTAYAAAAEHYVRNGYGEPMNERLANTIDRNLAAATKALAKSDLTMTEMTQARFSSQ